MKRKIFFVAICLSLFYSGCNQEVPKTPVDPVTPPPETKTYEITYMSEHSIVPSKKTVEEGYSLTSADLPKLSDDSYIFGGWYTMIESSKEDVNVGFKINDNIILCAKWSLPIGSKLLPSDIGDVVFTDGSASSSTESYSNVKKANAVGVVAAIYNENEFVLVATKYYENTIWASSEAALCTKTIDSLNTKEDANGTDNWAEMCKEDSIGTSEENYKTSYPAFYTALNHGKTSGYKGMFETGWYLPACGELVEISKNYLKYTASISKIGGRSVPDSKKTQYTDASVSYPQYYKYYIASSNAEDSKYYVVPGKYNNSVASEITLWGKDRTTKYSTSTPTHADTYIYLLPVYRYVVE